MVIYLCAITAIDRSLYEGAALDGATFLARVRYITIPMLKTTITTIFILNIGSILTSDFGLFYQVPMDSDSLQPVTQTLDVYVYKALMQQANFNYSAAASFLQSSVGCILLIISNAIVSHSKKKDEQEEQLNNQGNQETRKGSHKGRSAEKRVERKKSDESEQKDN